MEEIKSENKPDKKPEEKLEKQEQPMKPQKKHRGQAKREQLAAASAAVTEIEDTKD